MVSESSTGIVLPWEQQAIQGDELPDGLDYPDQVLYLNLRMLYAQKRLGIIDRETAISEKKKLLDEYSAYQKNWKMADEWCEIIRLTEFARSEFRKDPTVENGWKLVHIIEGEEAVKRKSDIAIGIRAEKEVYRLFPKDSTISICRRLGCNRKLLNDWRNGSAPSPVFLARILELGGDIQFILTGRRTTKENPPDFLAEYEEEL